MTQSRYRSRSRRITSFFARVILSFILWELLLPRIGLRRWSERSRSKRFQKSAARFRSLAVEMGGVMIKVGQFFSSRVDVLPQIITDELSGLQDEVPAEDFREIRRLVEAEFRQLLEEKYTWFDPLPLAAASLGQVHSARLETEDGSIQVVVKVQRPDIDQIIDIDLAALFKVGSWLNRYPPIRKRADVPALMQEFSRVLHEEIDYLAEGKNAERFAENFKDDSGILVPGVIWSHTTRRVLTLDDVRAIKITDYDAITRGGVDRGEVARKLLSVYLKQIFVDGFFHADPHPGNLFVQPTQATNLTSAGDEENEVAQGSWMLTFVDFGMVGRISDNMRQGMRELIIGMGTQDAARMVRSYQMMGVLLPGADTALLEKAGKEAFNRFWGKSMSELQHVEVKEMMEFAHQFRDLIYSMPFQIPEDLILLGRTVGILSGMCTGLDHDFNLWEEITPFARKLIAEETTTNLGKWLDVLGEVVRKMVTLPSRTVAVLERVERGDLHVQAPQLERQVKRLEFALQAAAASVIFAALLLGGVQLYLSGNSSFGIWLMAGAGFAFLIILLRGIRN